MTNTTQNRPLKIILISVAALVAIALIVLAVVFGQQGNSPDPRAADSGAADIGDADHGAADHVHGETVEPGTEKHVETGLVRRDANDYTALGAVDAPIVMIEFSDYRCPFCAIVSKQIFPELIEDYVDSGQLRIEWRDMPVKGEESIWAAKAARAAGLQGKFWEMNEAIYQASPDKGLVEISEEKLVEYAKSAGVPDLEKFRSDMNSEQFDDQIYRDMVEARSVNASGTPTFIIGNQLVPGAQPLETFHQIIKNELKKAENGVIVVE